ncbi:unnamed protein product [Rotaria sp. Silwood1]|nr:unnamed protein product [Rotaria sp. Silwood1]
MRIRVFTDNFWSVAFFCSFITGFIIIVSCLTKRRRRYFRHHRLVDDVHHLWPFDEYLIQPTLCNVCSSTLLTGFHCLSCGIYLHEHCVRAARRLFHCKHMTSEQEQIQHQWTRGNLPLDSECIVCRRPCGAEPRLCDYRCIWCQRIVHDSCMRALPIECDFGEFRRLIIPPNAVVSRTGNKKIVGYAHSVVERILPCSISDWCPLLVIGNRKSGGANIDLVLNSFRTYLNSVQVIDISTISPASILEWCNSLPNIGFYILVCGGDGTVNWILETIENTTPGIKPAVGILPMGTGNDLARILEWGDGEDSAVDVSEYLKKLMSAKVVALDRWAVDICANARHFGVATASARHMRMSNYFSVGCDALVTLNFHRRRDKIPEFFASRFVNKLHYFHYGTVDTFLKECKDLQNSVILEMDGRVIENLPALEGICILNIPSWGAGVRVWGTGENIPVQEIDDGLVEVFGIYSSFHIAQMQVGLADPFRIGQARRVKLTLKRRFPCQCDGEPFEEGPCVISLGMALVCMVNHSSIEQHKTSIDMPLTQADIDCPRLNNTVAIEGPYPWTKNIQGIVLGGYFWGYLITEIPGGYLAGRYGARLIFGGAMIVAGVFSIAIPWGANLHWGIVWFLRLIVGLAHGVIWPCMAVIMSRWAPPDERGKLLGFMNAGAQIGNVLALSVGGLMCSWSFIGGWPLIFYSTGVMGFVWGIFWIFFYADSPQDQRCISTQEKHYILDSTQEQLSHSDENEFEAPWKDILTSPVCWALFIIHTCNNWGTYTFLTSIPKYMSEVLRFDIKSNGLLSSLPYLMFWLNINISGAVADSLIRKGTLSRTGTRKLFNVLGNLLPAIFVIGLAFMTCKIKYIAVALLTIGVTFTGCCYGGGFLLTSNDIAPPYAGIIFGISNTFATLPGVLSPYVVGALTGKDPNNWRYVFFICAAIYIIGMLVFLFIGSGEVQPWAKKRPHGPTTPEETPLSEPTGVFISKE